MELSKGNMAQLLMQDEILRVVTMVVDTIAHACTSQRIGLPKTNLDKGPVPRPATPLALPGPSGIYGLATPTIPPGPSGVKLQTRIPPSIHASPPARSHG